MDTTTPEARFLWSGRRASSAIVHPTISLRSLDLVEDHFFNFRDTAVASTCNVFQSQIPPPPPPVVPGPVQHQYFIAVAAFLCWKCPALSALAGPFCCGMDWPAPSKLVRPHALAGLHAPQLCFSPLVMQLSDPVLHFSTPRY